MIEATSLNRADATPPEGGLALAVSLHREGRFEEAAALYAAALEDHPEHPDPLHFFGVLRHQQGRSDEAVELIERALQQAPEYVDAWVNLGNIHKESGRHEQAEAAYRRALEHDDEHVGAWNNLAVMLRLRGEAAAAADAYRRVAALAPDFADAYFKLGIVLRQCGTLADVVEALRRAIELDPHHAQAHYNLGYMLYMAGEREAATQVFRDWLAFDADNPIARHMLAALSGEDVPERAADDYVARTFDGFADSFDEVLLQNLDYHAPELLRTAVTAALGEGRGDLAVVDAGCGTGLCGPWLKPYARVLIGIDLSVGMLRKADARGGYDHLFAAELTAFLSAYPGNFGLIVSADTLCYFGALEGFAAAARIGLAPGGLLAFSVECLDEPPAAGYTIRPHGRYAHHADYVRATLAAAGLVDIQFAAGVLRQELGEPVHGWIVLARAPESA